MRRRNWQMRAVLGCLLCALTPCAAEAETISLHMDQASVQEVLRNLAEMSGQNLIFAGGLEGTVTAHLDGVTPEEALQAVIRAQGLAVGKEGETLILYDGRQTDKAVSARAFKLSYADASEVADSLKEVGREAEVSADAGSNSVIVSGTAVQLMQARDVIGMLDRPEKQVKVEAEVLAVNTSDAKELGIDWDFRSLTGSADYSRESWSEQIPVTDEDGNIKYDDDGYPRTRYREHSGWRADLPAGYAGISYGRSVSGHPYTFFFQAKLNALISKGKARVLAKPNVVTMNGRKAEILIGSRIPVIVEHMENGVKTTATEYRDAGIKLSYTPRISSKDEITATVRAEVSTPYLVPEMKAYRIITRQADTLVRLRSGEELVIGGLIDKETVYSFRKVPILGDIPLLGKLFQSKSTSVEESEIIIIIRANLIDERQDEDKEYGNVKN